MLTVQDLIDLELGLHVVGGASGIGRQVTWIHVSELADPTPWLEGGEFLLTTGIGVGDLASGQRAYLRRLADRQLAGLGFGVGVGFPDVPGPLVEEANRLDFPVLVVPYEVPFVAVMKGAIRRLANEHLDVLSQGLDAHAQLVDAVLGGRGLQALLVILAERLRASVAVVNDRGRMIAQHHYGRRRSLEGAISVPIAAGGEEVRLLAAGDGGELAELDQLILQHGQTAIALELARRSAVSAAELRLASDLIEDIENERLDEREIARRMTAFGLQPGEPHAALLVQTEDGLTSEQGRRALAQELDTRSLPYLSTVRGPCAAFLVRAASEQELLEVAGKVAEAEPRLRIAVGRVAVGSALGRSLVEAQAVLRGTRTRLATYRDLGALELLLGLPTAALEAFARRVLGPVYDDRAMVTSLAVFLENRGSWTEAAGKLGVHRHTLRYRMTRFAEKTSRDPADPAAALELWLGVKALEAIEARVGAAQ